MAIMFGDGTVTTADSADIDRVAVIRAAANSSTNPEFYFIADVYDSTEQGAVRKKVYFGADTNVPAGMVSLESSGVTLGGLYTENGVEITATASAQDIRTAVGTQGSYVGQKVFLKYKLKATTKTITVSGDTFPGTYYVQGDTYSRSDITGKDSFFQFIIPKAKMSAENTITLEAEGDPSTFNMNLTVLRPEDGEMMKLVQYDLNAAG